MQKWEAKKAKENLFLSFCKKRNIFGRTIFCEPSQFIYELPKSLIELKLKNKNDKTNEINLNTGDIVKHKKYGKGKIIKIEINNGKHLGLIDFWDYSYMELILEFTPLEKIE